MWGSVAQTVQVLVNKTCFASRRLHNLLPHRRAPPTQQKRNRRAWTVRIIRGGQRNGPLLPSQLALQLNVGGQAPHRQAMWGPRITKGGGRALSIVGPPSYPSHSTPPGETRAFALPESGPPGSTASARCRCVMRPLFFDCCVPCESPPPPAPSIVPFAIRATHGLA